MGERCQIYIVRSSPHTYLCVCLFRIGHNPSRAVVHHAQGAGRTLNQWLVVSFDLVSVIVIHYSFVASESESDPSTLPNSKGTVTEIGLELRYKDKPIVEPDI